LADVLKRDPLVLELGCGATKRNVAAVGVDVRHEPGVDLVADAMTALRSFPDSSIDAIYSEHFMEHVDDPRALLVEAARVLKPGGSFRAVIPHFSNPWFYSDPTHRSFYGLYTFAYWIRGTPFKRQVPQYDEPLPFDLLRVRLEFKSGRPFYVRHAIKKTLSFWVNLGIWSQEFYEEILSPVFPCYELDFELKRSELDNTE
jgi:SAM-dependent methyltransferase